MFRTLFLAIIFLPFSSWKGRKLHGDLGVRKELEETQVMNGRSQQRQ
jgi:hypothetical protein